MSNIAGQAQQQTRTYKSDEIAPDLSSFAAFSDAFPLQGQSIYSTLFERHGELVQTQKEKFAVANLEKILSATFEISSTSGFEKMSLRDLSKRAGMSMGAIYSCITKKEDIALMVADVVRLSSELTQKHAMLANSSWKQIEQIIRFHLYASSLLQPWYFFLYFETRSLPDALQQESKQIELDAIESFQSKIEAGMANNEFYTSDARMVANMIVVMLEDWYLKPWKNLSTGRRKLTIEQQESNIESYYQALISMFGKILIK
ncbi:MAG: TetR/AcrR family transcriptional regulator [Acidiferrobacterales bacterium]|nr:TetR/AcrR family transcriptional regulator [Acidiferrobacterales bacterium]